VSVCVLEDVVTVYIDSVHIFNWCAVVSCQDGTFNTDDIGGVGRDNGHAGVPCKLFDGDGDILRSPERQAQVNDFVRTLQLEGETLWFHGCDDDRAMNVVAEGIFAHRSRDDCDFGGGSREHWYSYYVGSDALRAACWAKGKVALSPFFVVLVYVRFFLHATQFVCARSHFVCLGFAPRTHVAMLLLLAVLNNNVFPVATCVRVGSFVHSLAARVYACAVSTGSGNQQNWMTCQTCPSLFSPRLRGWTDGRTSSRYRGIGNGWGVNLLLAA
jgi:hypothetical protein